MGRHQPMTMSACLHLMIMVAVAVGDKGAVARGVTNSYAYQIFQTHSARHVDIPPMC
jgi:hypothetical protein